MVKVTKLNGTEIALNADLIESIEATPDTVIALTTGKKLMVKEPVEDVIARIVEYRRRIFEKVQVVFSAEG
jgi:flagellar protein FlbD